MRLYLYRTWIKEKCQHDLIKNTTITHDMSSKDFPEYKKEIESECSYRKHEQFCRLIFEISDQDLYNNNVNINCRLEIGGECDLGAHLEWEPMIEANKEIVCERFPFIPYNGVSSYDIFDIVRRERVYDVNNSWTGGEYIHINSNVNEFILTDFTSKDTDFEILMPYSDHIIFLIEDFSKYKDDSKIIELKNKIVGSLLTKGRTINKKEKLKQDKIIDIFKPKCQSLIEEVRINLNSRIQTNIKIWKGKIINILCNFLWYYILYRHIETDIKDCAHY